MKSNIRSLAIVLVAAALVFGLAGHGSAAGVGCTPGANAVVCENMLAGSPQSDRKSVV